MPDWGKWCRQINIYKNIIRSISSLTVGEIIVGGEKHNFLTPQIARRLGIQTVYQEDILVPCISAAENIFLGTE